jgi:hypothetical protein
MPDLARSLQSQDLGHLRIVAELWGLELDALNPRQALVRLMPALLDRQLLSEVVEALPSEARAGLESVLAAGGRLPWPAFTRRFGSIREMGPGRRDREKPYLVPVSPAELLWYRALIGRDFFDTAAGPEEFAYIPEDLIPLLPVSFEESTQLLGRPATPAERAIPAPAEDRILDDACTLLAALRLNLSLDSIPLSSSSTPFPLSPAPLKSLLGEAGLLSAPGSPDPDATRDFLEAGRGQALSQLARAWLASTTFNELHLLPGLNPEGEWKNEPLRSRQTFLGFLSRLPASTWWSLPAFLTAIRERHPDFQRPAGDYDSWFIRDEQSGEFLRGFEHWDEVDGALVRFIIAGPMHWLGMTDLAYPESKPNSLGAPTAFRVSRWGGSLLNSEAPPGLPEENEIPKTSMEGRLRVPHLAPRAARYQVARFCEWEGEDGSVYRYRLTPASLSRAREQGLTTNHLITLLKRLGTAIPPSLVKALERWEENGSQVRMESLLVLRVRSPEILDALRGSRAARFFGDPLGPAAIAIKPGAWKKVLGVLAEMGYLGETFIEENESEKTE